MVGSHGLLDELSSLELLPESQERYPSHLKACLMDWYSGSSLDQALLSRGGASGKGLDNSTLYTHVPVDS